MSLIPLFLNLLAVFTGIRAVGDGRGWNFNCLDILKGEKIALIYLWVIGSTSFSLVHFVALLTQAPLIGIEHQSPFWLVMHSMIGLFFTAAHVFVDAVFEDKELAHTVFGVAP